MKYDIKEDPQLENVVGTLIFHICLQTSQESAEAFHSFSLPPFFLNTLWRFFFHTLFFFLIDKKEPH